jgi:hypothetical protein
VCSQPWVGIAAQKPIKYYVELVDKENFDF